MRPPTTRAAVERREAQGSSQGPARPGTPIPSRHVGSRKFGAFRPADRKAGQGSLASSLAPPGAPSPRFEGNGKQGYGRTLAARTKRRGGGALAIGGEGNNGWTRVIRADPSPLWGGWPSGGDSRARPGGERLAPRPPHPVRARIPSARTTLPTRGRDSVLAARPGKDAAREFARLRRPPQGDGDGSAGIRARQIP